MNVSELEPGDIVGFPITQYKVCKNEECLLKLNDSNLNYFWHETDHYTITSKKFIWSYIDIITPQTILNLRKKIDIVDYNQFKGICTDYPSSYLDILT